VGEVSIERLLKRNVYNAPSIHRKPIESFEVSPVEVEFDVFVGGRRHAFSVSRRRWYTPASVNISPGLSVLAGFSGGHAVIIKFIMHNVAVWLVGFLLSVGLNLILTRMAARKAFNSVADERRALVRRVTMAEASLLVARLATTYTETGCSLETSLALIDASEELNALSDVPHRL